MQSISDIRSICREECVYQAIEKLKRYGLSAEQVSDILLNNVVVSNLKPCTKVVPLVTPNGETSEMMVHIPQTSDNNNLGVLIFLHGAGSSSDRIKDLACTLGEISSCVVLCPNAVISYKNESNFDLAGIFGRRVKHPRWHYTVNDFPLLALRWALQNLNINPDRCIISGHSMGGIAAWSIAARFWHLFAAVAPINGVLSMWEMFGPDIEADKLRSNLLTLPILSVHGANDSKIPHSLELFSLQRLAQGGNAFANQILVMGGEHSLNTMRMQKGTSHFDKLGSWMAKQYRKNWPSKIFHHALDLSHSRAHWVEIIKFLDPNKTAVIHAEILDKASIVISTAGVQEIKLYLHRKLVSPGDLSIKINGIDYFHKFSPRLEDIVTTYRESLDSSLFADETISLVLDIGR
ncbi:prolyl oligopeptidase family serine peptidase [Chromobacterium amazonense]|uniref:Prolyl oligopeptidase family serine peptidase n=1 Tax=Chromobacterium amazonense TaxID=1382803 RepID=A0ABU8V345_9NEIS|nr:prolyl oligopeptidase family serine peptidase [Chromobacterium amazonense]MDQ4540677.1 prolyl oligopeptidase family serine peptidase [Chromobacterium amazonense]